MPKCTPCMSESLKRAIRDFTDDPKTLRIVDEIATCPVGEILDLCGGRVGKGKRQPSAYSTFIGECMRSKPIKGKPFGEAAKYMKECAEAWSKSTRKELDDLKAMRGASRIR